MPTSWCAAGRTFAEQVRAVVPEGADGLVDAALLNELAVPAVRDGGGVATVRGFRGADERGITFYPVAVRNYAREQAKLDRLRQQVEAGQVTLARGPDPAGRARRRGSPHPGGGRHARPAHPGVLNPGDPGRRRLTSRSHTRRRNGMLGTWMHAPVSPGSRHSPSQLPQQCLQWR